MAPRADDIVAERFRLVRELGRGAMGAVWLAHHQALDIPCAVKFIAEQGAAIRELRLRFEREARAAAQIRSPHVVQILDHGVWQEHPYIAMEYLEGETLGARLSREGRLAPGLAARVITHVARGLSKAHSLGIVHRDLKPDNLFLVRDDSGSGLRFTAKILDFGIAKTQLASGQSESQTSTGALLGTPVYMSPEQADGTKPIDSRCDLWSLGVITYRCVVGSLPFESEALGDLLMKIMYRPIPIPSRAAPDLPEAFDAWWARASERDPDKRFQSAGELADALWDALGSSALPRGDRESSVEPPPRVAPEPEPAGERQLAAVDEPECSATLLAPATPAGSSTQDAGGSAGLNATVLATAIMQESMPARSSNARRYGGIAVVLGLLIAGGAGLLARSKPSAAPDVDLAAPPLPSAPSAPPTPTPTSPSRVPASPATPEEGIPGVNASAANAATAAPSSSARPPLSAPARVKPPAKSSAPVPGSTPSVSASPVRPDVGF